MPLPTIKSELEVLFPLPLGATDDTVVAEADDITSVPSRGGSSATADNHFVNSLRLLWSGRRLLRRAAAFGLVGTMLGAFMMPKKYESTTRLMPPEEQSGAGLALMSSLGPKMGGGLGAMAGDILSVKTSGALFIGILGSRSVQDKVISKFNLRTVYGKKSWEAARVQLASNTTIAEDRKSGLIVISVFDRDPERAAGLAAEYVAELNFVTRELSTSSARREREFLAGRLVEVEKDLETAEKDLSEFASRNSAIDIKEQGRALVDAAALLQGQLIAGESELEGLKQVYADGNVRVRTLSARVAALRAQLAKLGGQEPVSQEPVEKDQAGEDPNHPSRAGDDREEEHSLYPSIRKLPLLSVPYADLYRRSKVQEAVFETLTQEYELAKVAEAKQTPSVKVLDPANLPETRVFPLHFFSGALLGACLAMAAAALWLFALTRWQRTVDDDAHKLLLREIFASARGRMRSIHAGGPDIAASPWRRVGNRVTGRVSARFRRSEGHDINPEDVEFRS